LKDFLIILSLVVFLVMNVTGQGVSESDDFSYALKLYNEEFFDLAAQQFTRFLNNNPGSDRRDEAGFYAGMSLFKLQEFENARIEFQAVAVNFPQSKRAADSWFMAGECYEKLGNVAEAAKTYETVKILYPQHSRAAESTLRAGQLFQQLTQYEKAIQLYTLIQDRYMESAEYYPAMLASADLYFERGEFSLVVDRIQKVISGSSDPELKSSAYLLLGDANRARGYYREAESAYSNVIKESRSSKNYPNAVAALSGIYLQLARYEDAQKLLGPATKSDLPALLKKVLQERLADTYYLEGNSALALKTYEQVQWEVHSTEYFYNYLKQALAWKKLDKLREASGVLRELVFDQDYFDLAGYTLVHGLYFDWLYAQKQFETGITGLYELKARGDFSFSDKRLLARYLAEKNDWQGVIRELEPSILAGGTFPEKDEFIFEVARAYEHIGQFEESARYLRRLQVEYPSGDLTASAKTKLEYLQNYYLVDQNLGVNQLALLLGEILEEGNTAELQFRLGIIYFENLKNYNNAVSQFEKSLKRPENEAKIADVYYYLGLANLRIAESSETSDADKAIYFPAAKLNLSKAMENISTASAPDVVAWRFVQTGIQVDKPVDAKQISYYRMLLDNYPESKNREHWLAQMATLYSREDSTKNKALNLYTDLCGTFAESVDYPAYLLALAQLKTNLGLDAFEDYRTIAATYPNSPPAAYALFQLAQMAAAKGKYEDANLLLKKLQSDYYYTQLASDSREMLGDSYLFAGQYDAAIEVYSNLLIRLPREDVVLSKEFLTGQQTDILFKLGKASFRKGQTLDAQKYLTEYLTVAARGVYRDEANLMIADIYLALHDNRSALSSLEKVTASDSLNYQQARYKMAGLYFEAGEYENAIKYYRELTSVKSGLYAADEVYARYIISLIRNGNKDAADKEINAFKKQFGKSSQQLPAFEFELGDYYRKRQSYDTALKYFNNVKKDYKSSEYADNAEYYAALTYLTLNKQKEALEILTGFASTYPNSDQIGAVLNTLGSIYFRSEKYESAILGFKGALKKELTPDLHQQVLSNLIKAYTFVNFWDAALGLAREYVETYPQAADVIDKKIIMAQAYVYLSQYDRAVELLRNTRLEADSEKEPEIQFYIGDAFLKAGQYENAIAEFVKIPLLSRKTKLQWEASALYYSGQAYEKLGRMDDAVRMYKKILTQAGIDLILKKEAQKRIEQIQG
jgi:tetratricopeptide (TPR) repeat protein